MSVLKGFALGLLGFILVLSLAVFGLAMTLNYTALNPDFIAGEINRIDTSSAAKLIISDSGAFPKEIQSSLIDTISKSDSLIKRQVNAAVYPVYDYLRGETGDIDLSDTLGRSILQKEFVTSLVNEVDVSLLVRDVINRQFNTGTAPVLGNKSLSDYVSEAVKTAEPQIKQQVNAAVGPVLDYILGKTTTLKARVSLTPVIDSVRSSLRQDFLKSPPPQFASLPPATLSQAFDGFFNDVSKGFPTTIEINESFLGAGLKAQVSDVLAQTRVVLSEARYYISFVLLAFRISLALIILSIIGIILINRRVKTSTRSIGITFVTYGALELAGIIVARYLGVPELMSIVPDRLQSFIPGLINDVISPLQLFSVIILAAGVVLIIVSFVYRPRDREITGAPSAVREVAKK